MGESLTTQEVWQQTCTTMANHLHNYQRGVPMKDRDQTVAVMSALCTGIKNVDDHHLLSSRDKNSSPSTGEDVSSVYGEGPLILSNIPDSCRQRSVVLGIDEAGRGSVIGPMVYGMCFWYAGAEAEANVIPKDFNDSKQLNESQRNILFETILQKPDIGFCARILHASEISRNMLRPLPYNLNQMSHNAAIGMIRALVEAKVTIQTCYIDTVGNPASYQRRLELEFPGIEFIVESKADDTYPPCSAASIGTYFLISYLM
jgi:ribonuclease H